MRLNLKKETLVILSNDTHSLPADLTPQVAGGGSGVTGGLFTSHINCGNGQTSGGNCTTLATCGHGGPLPTEACTTDASADAICMPNNQTEMC